MFSDSLDNDLEIITYIHDEIIDASGGVKGIHNEGLVRSALARPLQSAGGTDAYATTFEKAAALLSSIANNHGFRDGNKRTAMAAASYYLDLNDIDLNITNEEYETFMLHVVNDKPSVEVIGKWLNDHSEKIPAMSWKLFNAYEMNQAHPDTFHIPSPSDINELQVGSLVKLGFDITENIEGPRSERMWVLVIERNGNKFTGQLDNDPAVIRGLKYRDVIHFTTENILSIME
jgi:death-on-curing protein